MMHMRLVDSSHNDHITSDYYGRAFYDILLKITDRLNNSGCRYAHREHGKNMKKILIADVLKAVIGSEKSILNRVDVKLFVVSSNDEILAVHCAEKVNLIISKLDLPGMQSEDLYARIREDEELKQVSLILVSANEPADVERCNQCKPNEILTLPFGIAPLMEKVKKLLDVSWRESYRVLLSVNIDGSSQNKSFFCRSENISASGLLLETDKELAKGDRVSCSFFLPESKQIKTTGEIVRVMPQGKGAGINRYGVRFTSITADAKTAIAGFINKKYQSSHA
jgi:CheY-like chemotaxis protein